MSAHRVTIHELQGKTGLVYQGVCVCRSRSLTYPQRWEAENWELFHLDLVSRVRVHLQYGRTPSLASTRDYYREMEKDLNTPKEDRPLWRQLADELDRRLNDAPAQLEGLW